MSDFDILDNAEVETRHPDLDADGAYLLEIERTKSFTSRKGGLTYLIEFLVHESNQPGSPAGSRRKYMITDIKGEKNADAKGIKMANLIGFLAAATNTDPSSKQKWSEVASYSAKMNIFGTGVKKADGTLVRGGKGVMLRCKTGPSEKSKGGFKYAKHYFSAV